MKTLLVTGGAGFIGSALVPIVVRGGGYHAVTVGKLTYAGTSIPSGWGWEPPRDA